MNKKSKRDLVQDDTTPNKKAKLAVRKEAAAGEHETALSSQKRCDLGTCAIPVRLPLFTRFYRQLVS